MYSSVVFRGVTRMCFRCLHTDAVALARRPSTCVSLRARQQRRAKFPNVPVNPGINKSLEMLEYKSGDDIPEDDLFDLDDLETDFMNIHKVYKDHTREEEFYKKGVQQKMVEQKYFKGAVEPKLLTWEEKEQIHYLHKSNPEEWNPRKLSECFPASESTIQKILKTHWRPESVDRIVKYNEGVMKNWKLLSEGKLEISEDLRRHLSRFTSREKMVLTPPDPGVLPPSVIQQETISHEFSDIINSYQKKLPGSSSDRVKQLSKEHPHKKKNDEDTFVLEDTERKDRRLLTLDEYMENILKYRKKFDALDKAMVDSYTDKLMKSSEPEPCSVHINKFERGSLKTEPLPVPPAKITIPGHLKGKASLYKVEDCYYDVDGEFLYRVPGMTS